nr:helix-turn-helix transcriptional regulator [Anaerovirgula multivorans]
MDLSQISKQLGLSINHLIRLFKQHSGLTPTRYIAKRRVEKAAELLNQTDINILEISYTTGFKSLSNFYKCFKEETGHTPNEYRKSRGG